MRYSAEVTSAPTRALPAQSSTLAREFLRHEDSAIALRGPMTGG